MTAKPNGKIWLNGTGAAKVREIYKNLNQLAPDGTPLKGGTGYCPFCGLFMRSKFLSHQKSCASIPSAAEMAQMLDDDPTIGTWDLARKYGKVPRIIERKLLAGNTHWTKEKVRERSKKVKRLKAKRAGGRADRPGNPRYAGPKCPRCELAVDKKGDLCLFCQRDDIGVRSYRDLQAAGEDHPVWSLHSK